MPMGLPEQGTLFVCQSEKFIDKRGCRCVLSALDNSRNDAWKSAYIKVTAWPNLARIVERVVSVR